MDYQNPETVPAIRQFGSENPATCPWCGAGTWMLSWDDDATDNGRVQMYCDNGLCHSRETELIVMRGEGAHQRSDVHALHMIDDGQHLGEEPAPSEANIADPKVHAADAHRRAHRVQWRQVESPFTIRPE